MANTGGRGRSLEKILEHSHLQYWISDRVWIHHNRIAGMWRGKGRFVPAPDKSAPDFYGCDRGRFLAFDAKEVKKEGAKRWLLDKRFLHQSARLRDLAAAGALAFFAVEHTAAGRLYLLRMYPDSPRPAVDFGPPLDDALIVVRKNDDDWYDWLPAVRAGWI
jgi:penicillin-binding protein-related factor A (putative recombinase)